MDKVTLCTRALWLIGENDYKKDTPGYEACELWCDHVIHETLAAHDWSFARRRKVLKKNRNGEYALPPDCLRIIEVENLRNWRKYGARLLPDDGCVTEGDVVLIYTSNSIANEGESALLTPEFDRALILRLAAYICPSVAHDIRMRLQLEQEATQALDLAMTHDTQQDNSNDQHPLARLLGDSIIP